MDQSHSAAVVTYGDAARSSQQRLLLKACAVLGIGTATLVLFVFNPQQHGFYPFCMFHRMTGLLCPGCGCLRAIHELLHGHVLTAMRFNPLFVLSLPVLTVWVVKRVVRGEAPAQNHVSNGWIWGGMVLLLVFAVVRNLPFFRNSFAGF